MAGERLYKLIAEQHTPKSERSDIMYGVVISASPLKVQLANNMVIDDNFLILGKHIGKFKLKGKAKVKSHTDQVGEAHGNRPTVTEEVEYSFDNSIKKGDKLTMIRQDGGQQFYVLERVGEDGFGF